MTALALPSARDEAWRWSDLSGLAALAEGARGAASDNVPWIGCGGARLLFVDGVYDAARSDPGPLVSGPVDVTSAHPLGNLARGDGWTLALGRDEASAATIEIVHVATGGANHLPARIALSEDAQASIVETFVGAGWSNRLTTIVLAPSARLMRGVRLLQAAGFVSLRDEAALDCGASLVTTILAAGGADTRVDAGVALREVAAFAEYGGAGIARGKQRHDVAAVVRHEAEGGTSRQVWRAVADDAATVSLAARVEVTRGAQRTDAQQSLRGLLLKRAATINLKPELEIFADDVKCAHGATVGELDRNALFYLASRGLPPVQAQALLTRAFLGDALARIGDEAVREAFGQDVDAWLR